MSEVTACDSAPVDHVDPATVSVKDSTSISDPSCPASSSVNEDPTGGQLPATDNHDDREQVTETARTKSSVMSVILHVYKMQPVKTKFHYAS